MGLPKATINRAPEDLKFAGILLAGPVGDMRSPTAEELLIGGGVIPQCDGEQTNSISPLVPGPSTR
jgi:hypothetical protein